MPIKQLYQGLAYGEGRIQGAGSAGQVVRLVGDDIFALNTDATAPSFGMLKGNASDGQRITVLTNGGIHETPAFEGSITPGDSLKVSANAQLVAGVGAGEIAIAEAIAVNGQSLKFKLLI